MSHHRNQSRRSRRLSGAVGDPHGEDQSSDSDPSLRTAIVTGFGLGSLSTLRHRKSLFHLGLSFCNWVRLVFGVFRTPCFSPRPPRADGARRRITYQHNLRGDRRKLGGRAIAARQVRVTHYNKNRVFRGGSDPVGYVTDMGCSWNAANGNGDGRSTT